MGLFINHNRYAIQIAGPNKEIIKMTPGQQKSLPDYFLKYCPRYIKPANQIVQMTPNTSIQITNRNYQPRSKAPRPSPQQRTAQVQQTPQKPSFRPKVPAPRQRPTQRNRPIGRQTGDSVAATNQLHNLIRNKPISFSNDVGIGILSYNRLESIKRLLESIQAHTDLNRTTIFVSDESSDIKVKEYLRSINWIVLLDNNKRLGIAGNSNRLLRCLSRFKYKILLNDDVTVNKVGWDLFYVEAMQKLPYHHFCFRQPGVYGATDAYASTILNGHRIKTIRDKPHGAVMVFDDIAFNKVGFFDTSFGIYGMEHVDWSHRVWKSDIQPPGYHDIDGSENYFTIHADISACEHRTEYLTKAKMIFDQIKNSRIRVEVDADSVVPSVTYVIPYRDQDGRNAVYTVINNVKAQKFPNIELILVEQGPRQTINQIDPLTCKFVHSDGPFNKSKAFNAGVVMASNNILVLHDADIMATDNYTLEVYKILQQFKSCHIGKNVIYVNQSGTDMIVKSNVIHTNAIKCDRIVGYFEGGSLACHKDEYVRIGGFNEIFDGYGCEDCEFFERLKHNTNMYDERYVDFIHLYHGRSTGWGNLHEKNMDTHKKLMNMPMSERVGQLRNILQEKYKL
jgi:GT2 family glycosyltransferase